MKTSTRGAPTLGLPLFWNCVCRRRLGSLSSLNHCFNSRLSELSACEVTSEWIRVAVVTRPFLLSRVHRWQHAIINVLLNKPQCIDDASERNVLLVGLFSNTWGGGQRLPSPPSFEMNWVASTSCLFATQKRPEYWKIHTFWKWNSPFPCEV